MVVSLARFRLGVVEGQNSLIPVASLHINNRVLTAATAETETVPAGAGYVIINADLDVWVNFEGTTAVVPSIDITDGTGIELNPGARLLGESKTLSIISAGAAKISFAYYKI